MDSIYFNSVEVQIHKNTKWNQILFLWLLFLSFIWGDRLTYKNYLRSIKATGKQYVINDTIARDR